MIRSTARISITWRIILVVKHTFILRKVLCSHLIEQDLSQKRRQLCSHKLNNVLRSKFLPNVWAKSSDCRNRAVAQCCDSSSCNRIWGWYLYGGRGPDVNVSMFSVWRWWEGNCSQLKQALVPSRMRSMQPLGHGWMTLKPSFGISLWGLPLSSYCSWVQKWLVKNTSSNGKRRTLARLRHCLCRWWF